LNFEIAKHCDSLSSGERKRKSLVLTTIEIISRINLERITKAGDSPVSENCFNLS